jgi:hypothetical protein
VSSSNDEFTMPSFEESHALLMGVKKHLEESVEKLLTENPDWKTSELCKARRSTWCALYRFERNYEPGSPSNDAEHRRLKAAEKAAKTALYTVCLGKSGANAYQRVLSDLHELNLISGLPI